MAPQERRECRDRKEDKFPYKLIQYSTIIGSVGAIGAAIIYVGSFYFAPISRIKAIESQQQDKFKEIEQKQAKTDETIVEMKTDLKWIKEGISEIKQKLK